MNNSVKLLNTTSYLVTPKQVTKQNNKKTNSNLHQKRYTPINISSDQLRANKLPLINKLGFGRTMEEHTSWGINYDKETQQAKVKLWAPDADKLTLQYAPYDAKSDVLWDVKNPELPKKGKEVELKKEGDHYILDNQQVAKSLKPGMMYRLKIENAGETYLQPDFDSKSQPFDIGGWSQISTSVVKVDDPPADLANIKDNPAKIDVCEIHVGTFTKEHDFKGLQKKAAELRDKGYNTVQLMPVNPFYSGGKDYKENGKAPQDWGYNLQFTKSIEKAYGGVDEYKKAINTLHKAGLRVVQDVVYNHTNFYLFDKDSKGGPRAFNAADKNLYKDDEEIKVWGPRPKYTNEHMRNNAVDSALFFAKECKVDGLRMDSVHNMLPDGKAHDSTIAEMDRKFLKELVMEVKHHAPETVIYAEYENRDKYPEGLDNYSAQPIKLNADQKELLRKDNQERAQGIDSNLHTKAIQEGDAVEPIGFDAILGLDTAHYAHELIVDGKYNRIKNILNPEHTPKQVSYLTGCHDYVSGDFYPQHGKERAIVRFTKNLFNQKMDKAPIEDFTNKFINKFNEKNNWDKSTAKEFTKNFTNEYTKDKEYYCELSKNLKNGQTIDKKYDHKLDKNFAEDFSRDFAKMMDENKFENIEHIRSFVKEYAIKGLGLSNEEAKQHLTSSYEKDNKNISDNPADLSEMKKTIYEGKSAFKFARALQSLIPGPVLTFEGDESGNLADFRFMYTDCEQVEEGVLLKDKIIGEKGYDASDPSLIDDYTIEGKPENKKIEQLSKDLAKIREENPAITAKNTDENHFKLHVNKEGGVAMYYRKSDDDKNEILAVMNLNKDESYNEQNGNAYQLHDIMPEGKWELVINTDDEKYAGSGAANDKTIDINQKQPPTFNLAPHNILIYKKVS